MRIQSLMIALVAARGLAAQDAAPDTAEIARGDAVRITAPALGLDEWLGFYVSAEFDSVTVRGAADDSAERTLPLEQITRLEVNHGNIPPRGNAGLGAVIGGLGGLFAGMVAADPANADLCFSSSEDAPCSPAQLRGGLYGVAIGALLGAGVGALIKTRHWVDVPINPPEVSVAFPSGSAVAVGLAFRF